MKEFDADITSIISRSSRRSNDSHRSSHSHSSVKVVDEEAEFSALKVRRKFASDKNISEQVDKLDEEIAVREAKIQVFKSHLAFEERGVGSCCGSEIPPTLNARSFCPPKKEREFTPEYIDKDIFCDNDLKLTPELSHKYEKREHEPFKTPFSVQKLCEVLQMQHVPRVDLESFNGDPLEFKFFLTNFEEVVEKRVKDSMGRLSRLLEFTKGDAHELIRGCIYSNDGNEYKRAKELLVSRFGDPHRVLASFHKELRCMNLLKFGDSAGLKKLHIFLLKINSIVKGQYWNTLDSPENLCEILTKLPGTCRDKLNRECLFLRRDKLREPRLDDLITFLDDEVTLASDPLFSKEAFEERINHSRAIQQQVKPIKTLLIGVQCQLCLGSHDIEICPLFKNADLKEKSRLVMSARLCFGCYGKGHVFTDCTKKRICEKCKGSHPTSLHDQSKVKPVVKSVNVVCEESSISMCIVPVMLRHKDAKSDVFTYALLDSCSQGTFIDKDLINELCIQGEETSLTVKTLNGSSCEPTTVVKELEVRGFQSSASDSWNSLPVTYSRVSLPIDEEEIPTPVKIKNWSHLQGIANQLPVLSSLKVGLLIGSNCPKLIGPLEVIPSCEDGPFAFGTRLGWCAFRHQVPFRAIELVSIQTLVLLRNNKLKIPVSKPSFENSMILTKCPAVR